MITSLQNRHVKAACKLRDRRGRQQQQRLVIDGAREILRAMDAGLVLVEVFVCRQWCTSSESQAVVERAGRAGVRLLDVAPRVFEKVAFGQRAEGVVAVAATPQLQLPAQLPAARSLVAVLEGIEKPGNLGAIIRSADAAGLGAVLVADGQTDLYNPNVIRASLGTVFSMPVAAAPIEHVIQWLRRLELQIVVAEVDGPRDYDQLDYTVPTAFVLGSEATGVSRRWRELTCTSVRLPMLGAADSLNVSATAAVLFYEALRQRRRKGGAAPAD